MSKKKTLYNGKIFRRFVRCRYEFYWGLCVGALVTSDARDIEFIFILPTVAFQIEVSKRTKSITLGTMGTEL